MVFESSIVSDETDLNRIKNGKRMKREKKSRKTNTHAWGTHSRALVLRTGIHTYFVQNEEKKKNFHFIYAFVYFI